MKVEILKSEYKDKKIGDIFSVVNAYDSMKETNYLVYKFNEGGIGFLNLETCKSDYVIPSNSNILEFAEETIFSDLQSTESHWFDGDTDVKLILKGN